jgi:sulfur carrier protein ThiS adenylyltransferase
LAGAWIVLIGCGGLGSEIGLGLMRKGVGKLTLVDHDKVELSNLPRQFFQAEDINENKALALAKNLRSQATGRTLIEAYAQSFQRIIETGNRLDGSIIVVGVDNNMTRMATAEYYLQRSKPVITLAVDDQASKGYVFVQTSRKGEACFLCLFPDAREDRQVHQCSGASIEILKVVAGIALYAIDSLLMDRPRPWNYKAVFLNSDGDGQRSISQRPECPLCCNRENSKRNL